MKMQWLVVSAILFASCVQKTPQIKIIATRDFVLIDTSQAPVTYFRGRYDIDFPIYYQGLIKDTICIGKKYRLGQSASVLLPKRGRSSKIYSNRLLKIVVDTSFLVNDRVEYYNKDGSVNEDSTQNYSAYLFTIKNISDSIVWMGRTFSVFFLYLEIKNKRGDWIKVGENLADRGICGTFQPHIYLMPGEIILSKVALYRGSFITDCRLVFGYDSNLVYSNVFQESVEQELLVGSR